MTLPSLLAYLLVWSLDQKQESIIYFSLRGAWFSCFFFLKKKKGDADSCF